MNRKDRVLERWVRKELHNVAHNLILRDDAGGYDLFGRYRIEPQGTVCVVYQDDMLIGEFTNTRVAVSWCVASKYRRQDLADNLLITDRALENISADIDVRSRLAERSRKPRFREDVGTKLETKIIRRRKLENQLSKYVDWAKYLQQRGFQNETARTGRTTQNRTNR
jgi:hypothetical protein